MSRPDLPSLSRWICWKIDLTNTQRKEPFDPSTNRHAACDDPTSWCDYKTAKAAVDAGRYDAIGFVLGKEVGLAILDLDGCRNAETGEIAEWAQSVIDEVNSCTEISYSQDGIHVLVYGEIPRNIKQTKNHVGVEMYDCDRMFALTGKFLDGLTKIEERDLSELHRRVAAKLIGPKAPRHPLQAFAHDDTKFRKLCDADFVGWSGGPSEAVASVLVTLARLHSCDRDKMAEEFEQTKLCELWENNREGRQMDSSEGKRT